MQPECSRNAGGRAALTGSSGPQNLSYALMGFFNCAPFLRKSRHPERHHESLVLLREAVLRLTQQAVREAPTSAPTSRLTKLGPDDDVEAYLEVFERTARRESWPEDQWAHILSLFLTGPAQQASKDLPPEHASQYPALKHYRPHSRG